jgi:hypothetical protein
MREDLALKLCVKRDTTTEWNTAGGKLSVSCTCKMYMQLPKLSSTLGVEHKVHITKKLDRYDMILNRYLLRESRGTKELNFRRNDRVG